MFALSRITKYKAHISTAVEKHVKANLFVVNTVEHNTAALCGQLNLRSRRQNPVLLNSHTNYLFSYFRIKRPAPDTCTLLFAPRRCLLTKASTVCSCNHCSDQTRAQGGDASKMIYEIVTRTFIRDGTVQSHQKLRVNTVKYPRLLLSDNVHFE